MRALLRWLLKLVDLTPSPSSRLAVHRCRFRRLTTGAWHSKLVYGCASCGSYYGYSPARGWKLIDRRPETIEKMMQK